MDARRFRTLGTTRRKGRQFLVCLADGLDELAARTNERFASERSRRATLRAVIQRWEVRDWVTIGCWDGLRGVEPLRAIVLEDEDLPPLGPALPWGRKDRRTTVFRKKEAST